MQRAQRLLHGEAERGLLAEPVGDEHPAVAGVGEALQAPGDEQAHPLRGVRRIGKDELARFPQRRGQAQPQVGGVAPHVESALPGLGVEVCEQRLVGVDHAHPQAVRASGQEQAERGQVVVADAEHVRAAQVEAPQQVVTALEHGHRGGRHLVKVALRGRGALDKPGRIGQGSRVAPGQPVPRVPHRGVPAAAELAGIRGRVRRC